MAQILLGKNTLTIAQNMHQLPKMFWRRLELLNLVKFLSLRWNSRRFRARKSMILLSKTPMFWIVTRSRRRIITQRRSHKRTVTSSKVKQVQIVLSPTKTRNCFQPWLSKQELIWLPMDRIKHKLIQLCFHRFKRLISVEMITATLQSCKRYRKHMLVLREKAQARKPTESSLPYQRRLYPSQKRTKSSPWETCQFLIMTATSQHAANETYRTNSIREIISVYPKASVQLSIIHQ